ncbi:uncharacterized protein F4817DRAFT_315350 [Daldinia loculata]|uniref:uncharacterized protein n=1 Tax=Daldinia loculata TaxID=103429 RepID=UPI0020C41D6D|nr:uncharacterized protein F4817DRAFT_315350 [Daldinia loculata]KAI1647810.1 hypothetical protein F4817DRAFT_315350 [Daldinia loculata]
MSSAPRTPSPRPKSPSEIPTQTPQFRAFSLSTLNGRFNHGNLEPVSPTSRAILNHYFKGLPTPSSNNQFREPSPFYLPTSDSGSDSTCRRHLKLQQKIRPTNLPSVAPPLRPSAPGSPCPRRGRKQQSRPNVTSDNYTAKEVPKKDPARKSLAKGLYNLRSRDSIPSTSRKHNNPRGAQLLGRTTSSKRRASRSTKKRSASQYENTEDSHDDQVDDGRPSAIDQGPPKKRTKRYPSTPEADSATGHPVPSHRQVDPL